ncbi:sigma-70 family RNA polymerase sigma factor [Bacillus sp. SCS-151]|uniref:sigma-70 family RNA polymerase sigma factor n=1 Tax=Nanhaiella sioensis TaxID=3115293 RepID=UPI003979F3D2
MTDEELHSWLKELTTGSEQAFEIVYEEIHHHVYRTIYFLVNNKQDANDVANEVYIQLIKSIPKYDMNKPFYSWLNGLIVKQTANWNRKLWRKFNLDKKNQLFSIEEHPRSTEETMITNEMNSQLLQHVNRLPYKLKVVIVLRYFHDNSFEEIANTLNIPIGTAKSRHHHALKNLRNKKLPTESEASLHVH